jgi:cell division protein FtsB
LKDRLRLLLLIVFAAGATWFAVQGGEYGTADLLRQHRQRANLEAEIDSLTRVVDSLTRHRARVLNDARTQERIAREEFGMIRGNELLYRFAEPDSL